MKKKLFIGIAMSLFAVATVFNMNMLNENGAGDVSLDALAVMAQAQDEGGGSNPIPEVTVYGCSKWAQMKVNGVWVKGCARWTSTDPCSNDC
jgi:hypothetical protein